MVAGGTDVLVDDVFLGSGGGTAAAACIVVLPRRPDTAYITPWYQETAIATNGMRKSKIGRTVAMATTIQGTKSKAISTMVNSDG